MKTDYKQKSKDKVRNTLDCLIDKLVNEESLPGYLAKSLFLPADIPSAKWSLRNKMILMAYDCFDARGYKQWKKANRVVKKGSQAIYILAPVVITKNVAQFDETTGNELEEEKTVTYFKPIPVFRYQDTEGEEPSYIEQATAFEAKINDLPLIDVAKRLNIPVEIGYSLKAYGYYSFNPLNEKKKIVMCSNDIQTWLHELSHAIDHQLGNISSDGSDMDEVVAELSACFLSFLHGLKANMRYTRQYVTRFSGSSKVCEVLLRASKRVLGIYGFVKGCS